MMKVALFTRIYGFLHFNTILELVSGFQGSSTFNTKDNKNSNSLYKWSHSAGTYCGLCSLVILGDDLSRVNRKAIINSKLV